MSSFRVREIISNVRELMDELWEINDASAELNDIEGDVLEPVRGFYTNDPLPQHMSFRCVQIPLESSQEINARDRASLMSVDVGKRCMKMKQSIQVALLILNITSVLHVEQPLQGVYE